MKENVRTKESSKAYSYEATKIELLSGQSGDVTMTSPRNDNNSILTAKLQKIAVIFAGNRKFNAIRLDY